MGKKPAKEATRSERLLPRLSGFVDPFTRVDMVARETAKIEEAKRMFKTEELLQRYKGTVDFVENLLQQEVYKDQPSSDVPFEQFNKLTRLNRFRQSIDSYLSFNKPIIEQEKQKVDKFKTEGLFDQVVSQSLDKYVNLYREHPNEMRYRDKRQYYHPETGLYDQQYLDAVSIDNVSEITAQIKLPELPYWEGDVKDLAAGLAGETLRAALQGGLGIPPYLFDKYYKHGKEVESAWNQANQLPGYSGIMSDVSQQDIDVMKNAALLYSPIMYKKPFLIEAYGGVVSSLAAFPLYAWGLSKLGLLSPTAVSKMSGTQFLTNFLKAPFYTQAPQVISQPLAELEQGTIKSAGDLFGSIAKSYIRGLAEVTGEAFTPLIIGEFGKLFKGKIGGIIDRISNKINIDIDRSMRYFLVDQPLEVHEEEISNLLSGEPSIYTGDFNPQRLLLEGIAVTGMGVPLSLTFGVIRRAQIQSVIDYINKNDLDVENRYKTIRNLDENQFQDWLDKVKEKSVEKKLTDFVIELFETGTANTLTKEVGENFLKHKEEVLAGIENVTHTDEQGNQVNDVTPSTILDEIYPLEKTEGTKETEDKLRLAELQNEAKRLRDALDASYSGAGEEEMNRLDQVEQEIVKLQTTGFDNPVSNFARSIGNTKGYLNLETGELIAVDLGDKYEPSDSLQRTHISDMEFGRNMDTQREEKAKFDHTIRVSFIPEENGIVFQSNRRLDSEQYGVSEEFIKNFLSKQNFPSDVKVVVSIPDSPLSQKILTVGDIVPESYPLSKQRDSEEGMLEDYEEPDDPYSVYGGNISSNEKGIFGALTNPTEIAKKKGNIRLSYPVNFRGQSFPDAEAAYKKFKTGTDKDFELMTEVITAKLSQYPSLVKEITKRGGTRFLEESSHIVGVKGSRWEGKGQESKFIQSLIGAYERVTAGMINTPQVFYRGTTPGLEYQPGITFLTSSKQQASEFGPNVEAFTISPNAKMLEIPDQFQEEWLAEKILSEKEYENWESEIAKINPLDVDPSIQGTNQGRMVLPLISSIALLNSVESSKIKIADIDGLDGAIEIIRKADKLKLGRLKEKGYDGAIIPYKDAIEVIISPELVTKVPSASFQETPEDLSEILLFYPDLREPSGLESGNKSVNLSQILEQISQRSYSADYRELALKLLPLVNKDEMFNVHFWKDATSGGRMGQFLRYPGGTEWIDVFLANIDSPSQFERVLLHETLHKYTTNAIFRPSSDVEKRFSEEIKSIYGILKDNGWHRGIDNEYELVTEAFTNRSVQMRLANCPVPAKSKSLWRRFIDAIRKLITYEGESNALEQIIASTTNFLDIRYGTVKDKVKQEMQRDPAPIGKPPVNDEAMAGIEDRKIEQAEDIKVTQTVGSLVREMISAKGQRMFPNYRSLWETAQGVTYEEFEKMIMLGVDKNGNKVRDGIDVDFVATKDTEMKNGYTYLETAYYTLRAATSQTVAVVYADGTVSLLESTTWQGSTGSFHSTIRRRTQTEVHQEKLKEKGFDAPFYRAVSFVDSKGKISDKFQDWHMLKRRDEPKFTSFVHKMLQRGFVAIPTTKATVLIDIRSLKIDGVDMSWNPMALAGGRWYDIWKEAPKSPLVNAAVQSWTEQQKQGFREWYRNRNKFIPAEHSAQLNEALYDTVYTFVMKHYLSRMFPGVSNPVEYFKRLDNIGGDGPTSIALPRILSRLPQQKIGNWIWTEGEDIKVNCAILSSDIAEALELFGKDFKPGDGAAFQIKGVSDVYNDINFVDFRDRGASAKAKFVEPGRIDKAAYFTITEDTHPALWKFMTTHNIGRVYMSSAIKNKFNLTQGLEDPAQMFVTQDEINSNKLDNRGIKVFEHSLLSDAKIFSKGEVKTITKGSYPAFIRAFVFSLLPSEAQNSIVEHYKKDVKSYQSFVNSLDALTEIKRLAKSTSKQGYIDDILRLANILSSEHANLLMMDIFADKITDGVLKEKLQDVLNHAQEGYSPVLYPDMGNFRQYLIKSGQITEEQAKEYFYDSGYLKPGYAISDWFSEKRFEFDKVLGFCNPPSGYQDAKSLSVIGKLPQSLGSNVIVVSNKQFVIDSGKDFDIDIVSLIPVNTREQLDIWEAIRSADFDTKYDGALSKYGRSKDMVNLANSLNEQAGYDEDNPLKIEPEDAILAHLFGLTGFKGIDVNKFEDYMLMYDAMTTSGTQGIGALYNIALIHGTVNKPTEKEMYVLNRLTHLVLDKISNLKLLTIDFNTDKLKKFLFGKEDIEDIEEKIMPARRLVKFRESGDKDVTFGAIVSGVRQAAQFYRDNTEEFGDIINNPMVQTVLELDSVDYSRIRLTPEQSQKVGNQLYNTLVGEKELFYRGEFVKLENLSYFAEILSRLAEFGNLPSRIADIRATGNRYLVINDAQRLTIVKSLSEKLYGSPRVYIDFLTAFLGGNNFALTDKFGRVEFNANNGKRFTLSQSKDDKGVLSGNIIYTVQGVSNGKVIEERVYDNIKLMPEADRNLLFNRADFAPKMFGSQLFARTDSSKQFVREFVKDFFSRITEHDWFQHHTSEQKALFYYGILGLLDPEKSSKWGLISPKFLKEYDNDGNRVRAVSFADPIYLMKTSGDQTANDVANRFLDTLSNAIGSAVEVYPLEAPDHAVLNPDREFSDIERARMVNDIISRFGAIASDNQVAGLWNSIREDKVKPSDVRDGHRAFWVENLIENLLSLKRTITTLNPNTSFSVERELYRYFNKAASTFKIGGTERRGLRLWGRNIPFNRAIRYLSNRNKVYADNEVVSSWYVGGKSHKAKAFEIARMFDLMYLKGTPQLLSGAMIDMYTRLMIHYSFANLERDLTNLIQEYIGAFSSTMIKYDLAESDSLVIDKGVQAEIWDIAEGRGILDPTFFRVLPDGTFQYYADNYLVYERGSDVARAKINYPEMQRLATAIASPHFIGDKVTDDMLVRKVISAITFRYMFDYLAPALIQTQMSDFDNTVQNIVLNTSNEDVYSESIGQIKTYYDRLQNMLNQIAGRRKNALKKGLFYMPHQFESYKSLKESLVSYFQQTERLSEKLANRRANEEIQRMQKSEPSLGTHSIPPHGNFYHREFDVSGYVKDIQVANKYFSSLMNIMRQQMLSAYESVGQQYTVDETAFMKHELAFMGAVMRNQETYAEYTSFDKLNKGQFVLFEERRPDVKVEEEVGGVKQERTIPIYKTVSGEVLEKEDNVVKIYRPMILNAYNIQQGMEVKVKDVDGQVYRGTPTVTPDSLIFGNREVFKDNVENVTFLSQSYGRFEMSNLRRTRGVNQMKKAAMLAYEIFGHDFYLANADRLITLVSNWKIRVSTWAMLAFKWTFGLRNFYGGFANMVSYFGWDDTWGAANVLIQFRNKFRATKNKEGFSKRAVTYLDTIVDKASVLMGDVDKIMGRFGGIVTVMGSELSPEMLRLWNKTDKEWKTKRRELQPLLEQIRQNPNSPEVLGLKESFATKVVATAKIIYAKEGLYNFPFGMLVSHTKIMGEVFNPRETEVFLRDFTAIAMAKKLMDLTSYDELSPEQQNEVSRYILAMIQHAINSTQFQYVPGAFLSHFDSTVFGKAWFKQFAHYTISLEYTYLGRIENHFRQIRQLGLTGAGVDMWSFLPGRAREIQYTDASNIHYQDYIELDRTIRMTAAAGFTYFIRKLSQTGKIMFLDYLGGGITARLIDALFFQTIDSAVNIPILTVGLNWVSQLMSSLINTVIDDKEDDALEKKVKKMIAQSLGESEEEYLERWWRTYGLVVGKEARIGIGVEGGYHFSWEEVVNDYWRDYYKRMVWQGYAAGVGETQLFDFLSTLAVTGFAPDNIRELMFSYGQTVVPMSYMGIQFLKGTDFVRDADLIPSYTTAGTKLQKIKSHKLPRAGKPKKEYVIDLELPYFMGDKKIRADYDAITKEDFGALKTATKETRDLFIKAISKAANVIGKQDIPWSTKVKKMELVYDLVYEELFGVTYVKRGKIPELLMSLKKRVQVLKEKELNKEQEEVIQ